MKIPFKKTSASTASQTVNLRLKLALMWNNVFTSLRLLNIAVL